MKAVVLVGGLGMRLRPLTATVPKPMLPLVNRPFFERTVRRLAAQGVDEVIVSGGYLGERFEAAFADGHRLGVKLVHSIEQQPLGTAGAVRNVAEMLDGGPFLVLNGDILSDIDVPALVAFHRERGAEATLALTAVGDPTAFGLVPMDASGRVQRFVEKPSADQVETNLINAGCYCLSPGLLERVPPARPYSFERGLFPELLAAGRPVFGFQHTGYWRDIGSPANYLAAHVDILDGVYAADIPGTEQRPRVFVGDGVRIDPSATVFGPVVIGSGTSIGPGAVVSSHVCLGEGVTIAAGARVAGSVIGGGSHVGEGCAVTGSVLARDVQLGARCVLDELVVAGEGASVGAENRLSRGVRLAPYSALTGGQLSF
ncbi:MAG TPA: NDP-sugar synthase [Coriobacteriia bacterium]|jgi:mannose-1-phosphate guanylyltransferase